VATITNFAAILWIFQNTFSKYWHTQTDPHTNPFRGMYQLNGFDLAIIIPYFIVLVVLALYGMHRYVMVYNFYKYRQNVPGPPPPVTEWPRVTVQLPIFNERYVIERLVEAVSHFDYPPELLDVQVLDDSTDETCAIARACVERFQALGMPISYLHRTNREGYKAGALAEGLKVAKGEYVAIFDADFLPSPDFLRRTVPYFTNKEIAMVQTRWTYLNADYSLLTQVEHILLDGHFVIEHGARSRRGSFFNFNGTAGVWRRTAIEDAGGWQHDTLTEDTDLSYRAQLKGWHFLYLPDIECASELPVEMNSFKSQQARWAKGLMQTAKKILPRVMRSDAPIHVKAEAFFHLTANISYPLMVVLSTMLLPAMIVRFYQGSFQMLVIDLPLFLASTCSISSFYLVAQRNLYPKSWKKTFLYMPFVMAIGIGISIRNAVAVLEALWGKKSEFVRTPKYNMAAARVTPANIPGGDVASDDAKAFGAAKNQKGSWSILSYRNRGGWLPYAEIGLGLYFAATVFYAFKNENYATIPFLLLFVWGYLYTGIMSLGQAYFERLRFGSIPAPPEPRPAASGAPGF
jgi:cellulose synthase/poly-beta-1,6-N-acetylglucosamine synthase-like glycosyltransferase